MTQPLPTPDQCEQWVLTGLQALDVEAVRTALHVLAVQDPRRAGRLLEHIQRALANINPTTGLVI